jgi:glycosyltransferase involved in cell wall biosynthesis
MDYQHRAADPEISISAFFPAYNEEESIEALARKTARVLSQITHRWEIIIVNDGSRDRTAEIGARLHEEEPRIRIINHEKNTGYGGAVKTGLYAARHEYVFFTDGDGQFDVNEIGELIKHRRRADIVVGYRINRQDPWYRRVNAYCWGTLINLMFRVGVRDIDCAFKLIPRRVIHSIPPLTADGAMISTELLARARQAGYTLFETGVHHYPRTAGSPTGANPMVIARAFVELFKFRARLYNEGDAAPVRVPSTTRKPEPIDQPVEVDQARAS